MVQRAGGSCLQGTVNPALDYAYASLSDSSWGSQLDIRIPETQLFSTMIFPNMPLFRPLLSPFVTADNCCVVIDLRTVPPYMQLDRTSSQICNWGLSATQGRKQEEVMLSELQPALVHVRFFWAQSDE